MRVDEAPEHGLLTEKGDGVREGRGKVGGEVLFGLVVTLPGAHFERNRLDLSLVLVGNVDRIRHVSSYRAVSVLGGLPNRIDMQSKCQNCQLHRNDTHLVV